MKPTDDDPRSVHLPDEQLGKEERNNSSSTKLLLSESRSAECREETANLMQMCRQLVHQLNNLLTTILANTQLMCLMVKDEELKIYLRIVEDATRNAGVMVREFQESVRAHVKLPSQEDVLDEAQKSSGG